MGDQLRIWIDLANSRHPLPYSPIGEKLQRRGQQVVVTVRDHAQTGRTCARGLPSSTLIGEQVRRCLWPRQRGSLDACHSSLGGRGGLNPDRGLLRLIGAAKEIGKATPRVKELRAISDLSERSERLTDVFVTEIEGAASTGACSTKSAFGG